VISPFAHEAIVRISRHPLDLSSLTFVPFSFSARSLFISLSAALSPAINPFSSADCNDTAIGETLSRSRSPSS